jgi:hypothetical protein
MLIVEFADLEIGRPDERYSASMAEYLPKPLRTFCCGGGARAFNRFTGSNAAINEVERQCYEKSNFCHRSPLCCCRDNRMAMAQKFEFEPWPPDGRRQVRTPKPPPGPKGGASRIDPYIAPTYTESSGFFVCPSGLTASRSKPNELANSALVCMAKFLLALIALAFAVLIGAFVFASFTLWTASVAASSSVPAR